MARRADPRSASLRHHRQVEQAVRTYAPRLWGTTRLLLQRWLREVLAKAKGPYERIPVQQRALHDFEVQWLLQALGKAGQDLTAEELLEHPEIQALTGGLANRVPETAGWLPRDPRRDDLEAYTRRILEDDLSSYWTKITDAETLARRLVRQKVDGVSYWDAAREISRQYGAELYRAERLVRSAYNSAANNAAYQDVKALYDEAQWITARDSRVRSPATGSKFDHQKADGQVRKVGKPFRVSGEKLLFPGDRSLGASAGNIVNCRCTVVGTS